MIYFTVLINILCLKFCLSISDPNNELQMIVDVVESYDKPTDVVAKVCWKSSKKVKLAKVLADLEQSNNIRYFRENESLDNSNVNNHILFLVDINCENIGFFFKQAEAKKMFSKSYRWLLIGIAIGHNNIVAAELEDLSILVDSEVIVAQQHENSTFTLNTIYKIKANSSWNIEYYGIWSIDNGLNKSEDQIMSAVTRRKDFKGEFIATSVVISDNRTKTDLLGLGNIFEDTVSKNTFRIINPLYDFLNASRLLVFSDDWGYLLNGTWNGMIGDLTRGKADLCGTYTFITKERQPVLEYLTHPTDISAKFVFRQPPLSYQNNLFLLPFKTEVWCCTGAFVLMLIIVLFINTKWDNKKYEDYNEQKMDQSCLPPTWSDITIFVLSAISQQGSSNELKGTLGRLVMFIVFLSFLFLYTSYSASIVALLQSTSNEIKTLSDLLNSKLELGIEDVSYNRYYFTAAYSSRDSIRKALYDKKIAPRGTQPSFLSLEEGVKKVQNQPYAFHMNTCVGYRVVNTFFQEHEKCGLQEIDFIIGNTPWLCSQKFSPYSEMFKVGYIKIQECGLSDRENRLIITKKPVCSVMSGSFVSVNIVDFYPVLLMLLYGMILAFVLLVIEILVHRRRKTKEK